MHELNSQQGYLTPPPVVPPPLPEHSGHEPPPLPRQLPPTRFVSTVMFGSFCLSVGILIGLIGGVIQNPSWIAQISIHSTEPMLARVAEDVTSVSMEEHSPVQDVRLSTPTFVPEPAVSLASETTEIRDDVVEDSSNIDQFLTSSIEVPRRTQNVQVIAAQPRTVANLDEAVPQMEAEFLEPIESHEPMLAQSESASSMVCETGTCQTESFETEPSAFDQIVMASKPDQRDPISGTEEVVVTNSSRTLGTVLNWSETPADAYKTATTERKLVFLIHVSGNFEIPGFT